MARLEAVSVTDLAGYKEISWQGLRPGENLLVGRNGAGKGTLLEAIVVGLNFLNGKRSGDLLNGANQRACIHLAFSDGTELTRTLGEIRSSQTAPNSRPVENVLYVHEGRRPKSRVGKSGRSRPTMHPTRRYEYVLNELQALLRGDARERAWVDDLLQRASGMRHAGHPAEWQWIRQELPRATQSITLNAQSRRNARGASDSDSKPSLTTTWPRGTLLSFVFLPPGMSDHVQ